MSDFIEDYKELIRQIRFLAKQGAFDTDEEYEDHLLDKADVLWSRMTDKQIAEMNAWAKKEFE